MKKFNYILIMLVVFGIATIQAQENENFYFLKTVEGSFEDVTQKVKSALKDQGFGVVTEIDMEIKINEKLPDANMKPYKILGVCNPFFAYKTLQIEENIGVFLPCKAIVKDLGNGTIEVVIVNPAALMGMLNKPELTSIAEEVSQKFKDALKNM
jgi:uncharacterized protein (DUF302 family)